MERYDGSEHGNTETYLIQGTQSNSYLTSPPIEQIESMGNEGAAEFVVDQGLYYPTATNYGYYCTGFELPNEWDDHQRFLGLDGPDLQYTGMQTESLPFVYYTPSYGYAQSPYNPYNPYIPGAIIGVDGPFAGTQQYYTGPTYQNPVSSPPYYPVVVQSRLDTIQNYSPDSPSLNTGVSSANRPGGPGLKNNSASASTGTTVALPNPGSGHTRARPAESAINQTRSLVKISEGSKTTAALSKQPVTHGRVTSGSDLHSSSSNLTEVRSASGSIQATDRVSVFRNPLKISHPFANGVSEFGSNSRGWATADKVRPRFHYGGVLNNGNGNPDVLGEQNRGPRTSRSRSQLPPFISVKAHTTKAGDSNAQGNIIIHTNQYNKEDFSLDFVDAKFFVIKSYSEDDVHKSIKYNVWSSTPNGNKRLDSAYMDAQRIAAGKLKGCPVFLFFSVNASGQFCGVAEMIGPVDFDKNMDFWQQDKWSGCFPVKWHIVKDVPNTNFRHIILENNENKPVTNSRDTQEIRYKQGMEMLSIFKNYTLKTSIIDDFVYYEERQKIMQEEKARLFSGSNDSCFFIPASVPPSKLIGLTDLPTWADKELTKHNNPNSAGKTEAYSSEHVPLKPSVTITPGNTNNDTKLSDGDANDDNSTLKIGSLTITPKQAETKPSPTVAMVAATAVDTESIDVVTVGTLPVKVNGFGESSSQFLRVGTIPLGSKALKLDKEDVSTGDTKL